MHVLTKFNPHITYTGRLGLKSFFVWIDFFLVKSISDFFHHTPSSDSEKQHPIPAPFMYITKKLPMILGSISSKDRNLIRDELTHVVNDSIEGRCC